MSNLILPDFTANKTEWNEFIKKHAPRSGAFLHSWEWADFRTSEGFDAVRFVIYDKNNETIGFAICERRKIGLGLSYLYCPKGPIVSKDYENSVRELAKFAMPAFDPKIIFFRFEPHSENNISWQGKDIRKTSHIQPSATLMVDLNKSEEDLLGEMHQKTRYNIKVASKHGVSVKIKSGDLSLFIKLLKETANRDAFRAHSISHYEKLLSSLNSSDIRAFVAEASVSGKVIASNFMIDYAGVRTYLHGASSSSNRNLMAPYLLHWELMRDAKSIGLRWYDFWGIAETDDPLHPWAGITRFKKGFGGEVVRYPGAFDLVLNKKMYQLYRIARAVRRTV
ncbi:MAG: hypothetical protein ACD_76C00076G0003 [uncultured bacterium]|nr:MAG: hypothetical protein ACD_76C00076G0003 [uncultured bacterium]HBD05305.1 hypothetical protein [Candidatus Uhrbacteria bacterium]